MVWGRKGFYEQFFMSLRLRTDRQIACMLSRSVYIWCWGDSSWKWRQGTDKYEIVDTWDFYRKTIVPDDSVVREGVSSKIKRAWCIKVISLWSEWPIRKKSWHSSLVNFRMVGGKEVYWVWFMSGNVREIFWFFDEDSETLDECKQYKCFTLTVSLWIT